MLLKQIATKNKQLSKQSTNKTLTSDKLLTFYPVQFIQCPQSIRDVLNSKSDKQDCAVLSFDTDQQAYLKVIYFQLINELKYSTQYKEQCEKQFYHILDDDQFRIHLPPKRSSPYFVDVTVNRYKRKFFDLLNDIFHQNSYQQQFSWGILNQKQDAHKLFTIFFRSLLIQAEVCSQFEQKISFNSICQTIGSFFPVNVEKLHVAQDLNPNKTYIYEDYSKTYILFFQDTGIKKSNKSAQTMFSHNYFTKNISEQVNQLETENQLYTEEKITRFTRSGGNFFVNNSLKPNSIKYSQSTNRKFKPTDPDILYLKSEQNHSTGKNGSQNNFGTGKENICKLQQLASMRSDTQQSIDDEEEEFSHLQMSNLDDSFTTTLMNIKNQQKNKNSNIQKIQINHKFSPNQKQNINQQIKKPVKYILNRVNSNKTKISSVEEIPNFKKIKHRRRKSQENQRNQQQEYFGTKQSVQSNAFFKNNFILNNGAQNRTKNRKLRTVLFQGNATQQSKITQPLQQQDNMYTKYGYINMNISKQFTDSVILKEIMSVNKETSLKIRQIKQKARKQREKVIKKHNSILYQQD